MLENAAGTSNNQMSRGMCCIVELLLCTVEYITKLMRPKITVTSHWLVCGASPHGKTKTVNAMTASQQFATKIMKQYSF